MERSLQQASQQLLAVQEAFVGDDVVDQFVREKEEEVEKSRPKEIDLTLPGKQLLCICVEADENTILYM